METNDKLVEHVVDLQRTSPFFAAYCVAHAGAADHRFLFADDGSDERRLYVRLLKAKAKTNANANDGPRALCALPRPARLMSALRRFFAAPRSVRGPHAPHMFRTVRDLDAFVAMLDAFQSDQAAAEETTQYMLRRLPMTETFLYVLWFCCDELAHSYCTEAQRGGVADENLLHAAGSMFFIASVLLMNHCTPPTKTDYYATAFDAYLLKMVETIARAAPAESAVVKFVRDTVAEWSAGNAVGAKTLTRMNQLVGGTVKAD